MLETCVEIFDEHTKWATENRTYSKQKAHEGLYRSIRESQADALGKTVATVSPAYTSQRCFECGHTESRNRRGSRFLCRMCGVCRHSDTNAAKNILFVHETDAKLHASISRSPISRRKALGGQAVVNQPTMRRANTA